LPIEAFVDFLDLTIAEPIPGTSFTPQFLSSHPISGLKKAMARTKKKARKAGSKKTPLNGNDPQGSRPPASTRLEQTEYDETIAPRDPALLSDTLAQAIKRHYGDSTSLEQGDLHLASRVFRDTTAFGGPRVAREMPEFLKTFLQTEDDDPSTCQEVASPHTMVIASSGIRVADLVRELRVFTSKESSVGKYFSKHMKLQQNIDWAKKTKVGIAVGTPLRLKELVENDAIKAGSVQRIVIDASYQNEKKCTIFDMADSFKPMLELLNIETVRSRLLNDNDRFQVLVF
jgi:protein CMS1